MRKVFLSLIVLTVVALAATACVLQEPEAASGPLEAIPLDAEAATAESEAADPGAVNEAAASETAGEESVVQVYEIVQAESEARFELDEDLRGRRQTVVGATDQVAGQIAFGYEDLSTAEVGTIQLNARTLATDNNMRNRAINRFILNTNDFEFITFEPSEVIGLPDSVVMGDTVEFTMVGDLTIRDVTNEVQFDVVATLTSPERLEGSASATVSRGDYGLQIPSVPNVANVEEEVTLAIDFVALAA
jgi:polyisoprenoid-binding protein YceI